MVMEKGTLIVFVCQDDCYVRQYCCKGGARNKGEVQTNFMHVNPPCHSDED